jgi:hypothetical protein
MMTLGMNLLIVGLIVRIIAVEQLNLFPFMFQQPLSHSAALGLILALSGFFIRSQGFILVITYDRQMSWHLSQIEKSTKLKSSKISIRTTNESFKDQPRRRKEARVFESHGYCQTNKPF